LEFQFIIWQENVKLPLLSKGHCASESPVELKKQNKTDFELTPDLL
jgi:hypothetical protein